MKSYRKKKKVYNWRNDLIYITTRLFIYLFIYLFIFIISSICLFCGLALYKVQPFKSSPHIRFTMKYVNLIKEYILLIVLCSLSSYSTLLGVVQFASICLCFAAGRSRG